MNELKGFGPIGAGFILPGLFVLGVLASFWISVLWIKVLCGVTASLAVYPWAELVFANRSEFESS